MKAYVHKNENGNIEVEFTCGICGKYAPIIEMYDVTYGIVDGKKKSTVICPDCAAKIHATIVGIEACSNLNVL